MSDKNAREHILAEQLASHKFDNYLVGKPLNIPQVNFTIPLDKKIKALSGSPYYALRLRRIEQFTEQLIVDLTKEYNNMLERYSNRPKVFTRKWKDLIESWPIERLNELIEKHNKYFPIEANLPIDPRSEVIMYGSKVWKPRKRITREYLLQRFPPDITDVSRDL